MVSSGSAHHGTYKAVCSSDGSSTDELALVYKTLTATDTVYMRGYFKFSVLPVLGNRYSLLCFSNITGATHGMADYQLENQGGSYYWRIWYWNGIGWDFASSTAVSPSTNTWYSLDLRLHP